MGGYIGGSTVYHGGNFGGDGVSVSPPGYLIDELAVKKRIHGILLSQELILTTQISDLLRGIREQGGDPSKVDRDALRAARRKLAIVKRLLLAPEGDPEARMFCLKLVCDQEKNSN